MYLNLLYYFIHIGMIEMEMHKHNSKIYIEL